MHKLSDILPKVLEERKLTDSARASRVCEDFRRFFCDEFDKENLSEIISLVFKNNILKIKMFNSIWIHQIYIRKEAFLTRVNSNLNKENIFVEDVVIRAGELV